MVSFILDKVGSIVEIAILLGAVVFGIGYLVKKAYILATGDIVKNENNNN